MMLNFYSETIITDKGVQPITFLASSGDLLVCGLNWYYHDDDKLVYGEKYRYPGMARWMVSHDHGDCWREVKYIGEIGHGQDVVTAGFELPDGRYYLYEMYTLPTDKTGCFIARLWIAKDGFRTFEGPFSVPVSVPDAIPSFDDQGNSNAGGPVLWRSIVRMPNNDLLATAYCCFPGDDMSDGCGGSGHNYKKRSILLISRDDGMSWEYLSTIAFDPTFGPEGCVEPTLVRISQGPKTGRLLCHMRTGSFGSIILRVFSDDDGKTWSKPEPLNAYGIVPGLTELSDGTLIFNYGTRLCGREVPGWTHGNRIMLSRDSETWSEPIKVPQQSNVPGAYSDPLWLDSSGSSLVELIPGTLLLVYDVVGCTGKLSHKGFPGELNYLVCRKIEVGDGC